jgi:hypothetical protein
MPLDNDTTDYALAFNAGSDARLYGLSLSSNPYDKTSTPNFYSGWRAGWKDVNDYWCTARRASSRPLPPVSVRRVFLGTA